MSLNTHIEYLYRDADNWKAHNFCIINGALTDEQKQTILSCRHEGEYFIPSKVGLPEERLGSWNDESDHIWFELWDNPFKEIDAPSTVNITPEELVAAFERSKDKWEEDIIFDVQRAETETAPTVLTGPHSAGDKHVRMVIEFDIDQEALDEHNLTAEDVMKALVFREDDVVDGFQITTDGYGFDRVSHFFLCEGSVVSKEFINERSRGDGLDKLREMIREDLDLNCEAYDITSKEAAELVRDQDFIDGLTKEMHIYMTDKGAHEYDALEHVMTFNLQSDFKNHRQKQFMGSDVKIVSQKDILDRGDFLYLTNSAGDVNKFDIFHEPNFTKGTWDWIKENWAETYGLPCYGAALFGIPGIMLSAEMYPESCREVMGQTGIPDMELLCEWMGNRTAELQQFGALAGCTLFVMRDTDSALNGDTCHEMCCFIPCATEEKDVQKAIECFCAFSQSYKALTPERAAEYGISLEKISQSETIPLDTRIHMAANKAGDAHDTIRKTPEQFR